MLFRRHGHAIFFSTDRTVQFRRAALIAVVLAFLVVLPGTPVFGQTDTGSIVGTVRDPSDAVIPGAQVDITNTATNVTTSFVTNGDGGYQALQLIPGVYSVKATRPGYAVEVDPTSRSTCRPELKWILSSP